MKNFDLTNFVDWNKVDKQYSIEFIKNSRSVKIAENDNEVIIAAVGYEPDCLNILSQIHAGKKIIVKSVSDSVFSEFVGNIIDGSNLKNNIEDKNGASGKRISLEAINSQSPVVNIINAICLEAVRKNASDIHIQKEEKNIRIRFRLDGVLHTVKLLELNIFDSIVNRLKVMSGLNVAENRLPQDGSLQLKADEKNIDLRVSFIPSVKGDSIVLRLFDAQRKIKTLEELGFSEITLKVLKKIPSMKGGLVLVSGPTGSGKTTTLHSIISQMDCEHLKIITIEDPVEKRLENVDQIQVNEVVGLTFESILRRILRQDPDVIMVGEIRDSQTAALAVRAGLTGHLVLSTVHTNDSVGVIKRLVNLGIDPYMVAGVLRVSLAQRLVRKIDKTEVTGYKGREAVSEVFIVDDEFKELIENNTSENEIKKHLFKKGFMPMALDGKLKVEAGITTEDEIIREVGA